MLNKIQEVKINSYFLFKGLKIYFLVKKSIFLLKSKFGLFILRLPSFYFYLMSINRQSFSLMFLSRFNFISFLRHLQYLTNRLCIIYFLRLRLKGLGYRVKRICKSLYRFYFTTTNYIYFHIPDQILVKSRKRRFILLSNNYQLLRVVFVNILLLKKLSPYNRRGIFYPRQIVLLKPGKKII